MNKAKKPRVLYVDIETAPIIAQVWGIYDQNIGLNQIEQDWTVLSWVAKFAGEKKIYQADVANQRNKRDDKKILRGIYRLLDEADVVVTQNGKRFDIPKLFARFIETGFTPPSSFRHIDIYKLARKHFGFTSNSLESLSGRLNAKYKKLKHKKFPGHELWSECLKGNKSAWAEMRKYNLVDVLALEECHLRLQPWDSSVRIHHEACNCGANNWKKWGYRFTNAGKYQRLKCGECGAEVRGEKA